VTDAVSSLLLFKKRPTRRGEMLRTMPRLITSAANSRGVQCVTGRPQSAGASQATATIWHSCSGVKVAGRPRRGVSRNTCWRRVPRVSSSASISAAASSHLLQHGPLAVGELNQGGAGTACFAHRYSSCCQCQRPRWWRSASLPGLPLVTQQTCEDCNGHCRALISS